MKFKRQKNTDYKILLRIIIMLIVFKKEKGNWMAIIKQNKVKGLFHGIGPFLCLVLPYLRRGKMYGT